MVAPLSCFHLSAASLLANTSVCTGLICAHLILLASSVFYSSLRVLLIFVLSLWAKSWHCWKGLLHWSWWSTMLCWWNADDVTGCVWKKYFQQHFPELKGSLHVVLIETKYKVGILPIYRHLPVIHMDCRSWDAACLQWSESRVNNKSTHWLEWKLMTYVPLGGVCTAAKIALDCKLLLKNKQTKK